jgi:hypothetical protein
MSLADPSRPSFRNIARLWLAAVPLAALGCGPASAEPQPTLENAVTAEEAKTVGDSWVKLDKDAAGEPRSMQTAIVRYVPAGYYESDKPPADYRQYVDLVGAVHIGDQSYYDALNARFCTYDAVLYELVAPEGTVVPRGRGTSSSHALGALQNAMKSMLEVEHQLEQIDYTQSNFVHADLSPDEFFESMDRREETFLEMYFRIVGASLAAQSQQAASGVSADFDIMAALLSQDRARRLKIVLASQFEGMESLISAFNGTEGSTIITERNTRALDVLEAQLDEGGQRLAIFYGAGHLADMHKEMIKRFDMRPVSVEWLDAWDLRPTK